MTYCTQWQHWVLSLSDDIMLLVSCVIGWALWMMVVLRKSCLNGWWCPNRAFAFANIQFGPDQYRAWLMKGNLVSFNGCIVQLLEHPCVCPCDTLTKLNIQFIPLALFLTAHLMGFSMESMWNSTWICNISSLEILWTFLMDSIVGMEWKNGWVTRQKTLHIESMEWDWIPPIQYGTYGGV